MTITLQLSDPKDWLALLPIIQKLKIRYQVAEQSGQPLNALQQFLLTGPVATDEDITFIEEKKQHFNGIRYLSTTQGQINYLFLSTGKQYLMSIKKDEFWHYLPYIVSPAQTLMTF